MKKFSNEIINNKENRKIVYDTRLELEAQLVELQAKINALDEAGLPSIEELEKEGHTVDINWLQKRTGLVFD